MHHLTTMNARGVARRLDE